MPTTCLPRDPSPWSWPWQCFGFGGSSSALLSAAPTSACSEVPAGPAAPCCLQTVLHIAWEGAARATALQMLHTNPVHPREALHWVLGFVQWVWKTAQPWRRMRPRAQDWHRTAALVCAVSAHTWMCQACWRGCTRHLPKLPAVQPQGETLGQRPAPLRGEGWESNFHLKAWQL